MLTVRPAAVAGMFYPGAPRALEASVRALLDAAPRPASTDTAVSRWTFTSLPPGQYRVYMSWTGDRANASNAPVTIVVGSQILGTTFVNQRVASAGHTVDGTHWFQVRTVTITGTTLQVVLSNKANGNVVADAVRIEKVGSAASLAGGEVLANGTVLDSGNPGSQGAGVFVASLAGSQHHSGGHEQGELHSGLAVSQPQDVALQSNLDIAPELGLLNDTLDLLHEVSRHVRPSDTTNLEGLFSHEQDWLAVL